LREGLLGLLLVHLSPHSDPKTFLASLDALTCLGSPSQIEYKWINRLDLVLAAKNVLTGMSIDNREDLQVRGRLCVCVSLCGRVCVCVCVGEREKCVCVGVL
jgi:hypothetical protein